MQDRYLQTKLNKEVHAVQNFQYSTLANARSNGNSPPHRSQSRRLSLTATVRSLTTKRAVLRSDTRPPPSSSFEL